MRPTDATPVSLFDGNKHYEIPVFQRPYVWDEEEQWAPLWDDITRVAESQLGRGKPIESHFLGAVVLEQLDGSASLQRFAVIDGQQRLTTLQLILDAARRVLEAEGHDGEAERLLELTQNAAGRFKNTSERFKLRPSRVDRSSFRHALDRDEEPLDATTQITLGHAYFRKAATNWLTSTEVDALGTKSERAAELCETLSGRLQFVEIDLSDQDDPQLIFETLNDRGTPLLRADLIKNWVFREGERLKADTEVWAENFWSDFDSEWWRAEIAQGRTSRSRVDIFLQYWLTMRLADEVKSERVFADFKLHAEASMTSAAKAESFLAELKNDADTYRGLADLGDSTPAARFRKQVIETMEQAVTMPIFLWFISRNHRVPDREIELGLGALESWATRRMLLRLTGKDTNRLIVALLRELGGSDGHVGAGAIVRRFLSEQTADSRSWPSDEDLTSDLPAVRLYGNVRQSRIRAVLVRAYSHIIDAQRKTEQVPIPDGLSIEHIMPREWRKHWDETPPLDEQGARRRDHMVHTIGNLTLLTRELNSALSNRPWTDRAAADLTDGGESGKGKRGLISKYSALTINRDLVEQHPGAWGEAEIGERAAAIADAIVAAWPGPDAAVQQAARQAQREGSVS